MWQMINISREVKQGAVDIKKRKKTQANQERFQKVNTFSYLDVKGVRRRFVRSEVQSLT